MKKLFRSDWYFNNYWFAVILLGLIVTGITVQSMMLKGNPHTHYNNYLIFKQSFFHLIDQQHLYIKYPLEYWDLYKYSPTFALFFGLLAWMPDYLGLLLWNSLNAFCLLFAFRSLTFMKVSLKATLMMLFFVLIELVTSVQNSQSNALIAGMIILAFCFMEQGRYFLAALLITTTVYIKIFGLFAFALFLFYPNKGKFIASSIGISLVMAILPLVVIPLDQLIFLYRSWLDLLINDHSISHGLSVLGWLKTWFNLAVDKNLLLLIGLILLGLPFLKTSRYNEFQFRISMLASILIWIVIFNHKAESPTFIIAMAGVAVWYYSRERTIVNLILVTLAFIFTSLSVTDIFPSTMKVNIFDPFVIKAVPCIIIWMKIVWDGIMEKQNADIKI